MLAQCWGREWEWGGPAARASCTRQGTPCSCRRSPCARRHGSSRTLSDPLILPIHGRVDLLDRANERSRLRELLKGLRQSVTPVRLLTVQVPGLHGLRYGGHAAPRRETSPARGPTVGEQQKRRSLAGDEPVEVRARLDALLHVERTEDVKIA